MKPFIVKDFINYIGIAVCNKVTAVSMIFVFPLFLSVEGFGTLNLFYSYVTISTVLMSLNIHTGVGRFIYEPGIKVDVLITTTFVMVSGVFVAASLLLILNIEFVAQLMQLPPILVFLFLLIISGQLSEQTIMQITIFQKRSRLMFQLVTARSICMVFIAIAVVLNLNGQKYSGVIFADGAVSVIFLLASVLVMHRHAALKFDISYAKKMMVYSLPMIAYPISLILLSQIDRIMIDFYNGRVEVGFYGLAYNLGAISLIASAAILNVLQPAFFNAMNNGDHERVLINAQLTILIVKFVTICLVLFGDLVASFLLPENYADAFDIIAIVAVSMLLLAVFQIWVRIIFYYGKTAQVSIIALIAMTSNIALNYLLLPDFGYKIAAYTTFASYLLMTLAALYFISSRKLFSQATTLGSVSISILLMGSYFFVGWCEDQFIIMDSEQPELLGLAVRLLLSSAFFWHLYKSPRPMLAYVWR